MNKEEIELLKRIKRYLPNRGGMITTDLMYRTPAQSLRESADFLEQQERDERLFDDLIKKYE